MLVLLLVFLASAPALPSRQDDAALRDTLAAMGPLMGHRWLEKRGLEDYLFRQSWKPMPDSGLHCVGRWSYGPSLKVSLRVTADDTVICLTRGSGASLIRFRSEDSVTLDLLGDVNFAGIPRRAILSDTLVVAGIHSGGTGLEVHGVSNSASPNLLSRVDLPVVNDIAVKDSLVFVACEDDTLRIFSIADPRNPVRVGACRDSCDLFMTQAGDYCYLVHVSGVNIVDVSDPVNPHRAGRIGGGEPLAVCTRDTLCYVAIDNLGLRVYDVSDPAVPVPLGTLALPDVHDLDVPQTCDTVLYTPVLDVVSVADPAQPRLLGHVDIPADYEYGVRALPALGHALVANYTDGVVVVDATTPVSPAVDTFAFGAGPTVDVDIDGNRTYLAHTFSGMSILDVADPSRAERLGAVDIGGLHPTCQSVTARDSFAYMHWYLRPQFQSVDVSDPAHPERAGGADVTNPPEDMVIRDTFVYVAEIARFQVVNVARPREPVLVGSCVDADYTWDLDLEGEVAAVAHTISLSVVDIAQPSSPQVVGSWSGDVSGVDIVDTIAYVTAPYTGFVALSIADPAHPYVLDSLHLTDTLWWNDVVVVDSLAYVGGERVWVVDVSDPRDLRLVPGASWTPPYLVRRLEYSPPYLYAACYEAGVCVLESTQVAISEELGGARPKTQSVALRPNPAREACVLGAGSESIKQVTVRDVAGRVVMVQSMEPATERRQLRLDLSRIRSGVYFIEVDTGSKATSIKLVKQ